MPSQNHINRIIAVVLTFVFCTGFFSFWLPKKIDQKSQSLIAEEQKKTLLAAKVEVIPQELIDDFPLSNAEDQQLSLIDQDFSGAFEEEAENFAEQASQILSSRFGSENEDLKATAGQFVVPEGLRNTVQFWTHLFGDYDQNYVVFYNEDDCGIVYSVLDFSGLKDLDEATQNSIRAQVVHDEAGRLHTSLSQIADRLADSKIKLTDLNPQDQRIAQLLLQNKDSISTEKDDLINSLKFRNGFAHRFKSALVQSGKYMPAFQQIFRERGLPEELTVLPFFESAFITDANSHAGAVGVWQFIEDTGKRFLRIDEYVDERRDPILAAYAATALLKTEFKLLKTWPLTINAYNTGAGRMMDAVKELKTTDMATITRQYKGSGYGFDSRNYFPEFLAALAVYNNRERYFGQVGTLAPEAYEYVATPSPVNLVEFARLSGIDLKILLNMNLSLNPGVASGNTELPRGYLLKIPPNAKGDVMLALQDIHREILLATHHVVKDGDSLEEVALTYEVPIDQLALVNNLLPKQKPKAGQILRLPSRNGVTASFSANIPAEENTDQDTPTQDQTEPTISSGVFLEDAASETITQ